MRLNKESKRVCRELFRSSFTNGKLDAAKVSERVRTLAGEKPRHCIDILKAYHRLVRLEVARTHAVIESAAPLTPEGGRKIAGDLRATHNVELTIEFKIEPELLGGLRIKIGSDVWDGSVRGRLQRLEQDLTIV